MRLTRHQEFFPGIPQKISSVPPSSVPWKAAWAASDLFALFGSSRILAPLLVCCPEAGRFFLRKSAGGGVNKAHAFSFSQFGGKRRKPEKTSLHCLALSPDERPVSGVFSGSGVILFAKKEREQG